MNIVFSIETDGLLDTVTKVHCIELYDLDTDTMQSYSGDDVATAVEILKGATTYTHNGIKFAYPVLNKLYDFGYDFSKSTQHRDTIILSRLVWPDIKTTDKSNKELPSSHRGSHRLDSFALRLKLQPPAKADWRTYSPALQQSCKTKCIITVALLKKIQSQGFSQQSQDLEHSYGWVIDKLEQQGFSFNERMAQKLYAELTQMRNDETDAGRLELITNRLSILGDAEYSLLRVAKNNRVHCSVISNGCISGRCVHLEPNIASIPGKKKWLGLEIRRCFMIRKGQAQVGVDASCLELCCLAHYLKPFDDGAYIEVVNTGDVHLTNQQATGLPTRDDAKEFIYKLIYGAGDELLGQTFGKDINYGRLIRERFISNIKGYSKLQQAIARSLEQKGYLTALDGRKLYPRNGYSALNLLLQSAGAIIMKAATVKLYQMLEAYGYKWGIDYAMVATIHDELQLECRNEIAEVVAGFCEEAIAAAGEDFGFRARLKGVAKCGINWAECH